MSHSIQTDFQLNSEEYSRIFSYNWAAGEARDSLEYFIKYTKHDYQFNWHHRTLCDKLERFARGEIRKLMVFMPPQHGKSQLTTRHLPAYILGIRPTAKIAVCCYSATLAQSFNRDIQRIIDDTPYHEVFPDTVLSASNVSTNAHGNYLRNADIFETVGHRGFVKTVGVGGSLTGTPVDIGIIDDPFKDREEALSIRIRDKVHSWFTDVFRTRLHNNSQELIIMCMAGDTGVLMADGSEKLIKDVRPGDHIATYENGRLNVSKVLNWKNQGLDSLIGIKMKSGIIVKANERHPFLVQTNGITKWKRLKHLKPGDEIIRAMPKGAHTKASRVPSMAAPNKQNAKDIAVHITTKSDGRVDIDHRHQTLNPDELQDFATGTELNRKNIMLSLKNKEVDVQYAESFLPQEIHVRTGMENCASIIVMKPERSEDCCVMTAISPSVTEKQNEHYYTPLNTYVITHDEIVEIFPCGIEDVFDIQVERTENFIANGLVSHNTRWDEDDLAGRILRTEGNDWDVVTLQAIKERDTPDDPRQIGEALWPERHSLERLLAIKETSSFTFSSLYQQEPKPSAEALVFPEWDEYDEEPSYTPLFGLDFGFANDPTAIAQVRIHNAEMWIREILYRKGLTTPDLIRNMELLLPRWGRIGADSADPRSIEDIRRNGWNVSPSKKGPDSIMNGINWMKGFRIHIHKNSFNLKNELLNYQWLMYGGKAQNVAIDNYNHLIDAIRYTKDIHRAPIKGGGFHSSFHKTKA